MTKRFKGLVCILLSLLFLVGHATATPDEKEQPGSPAANEEQRPDYAEFALEARDFNTDEGEELDEHLAEGKSKGLPEQVLFESRMLNAIGNLNRKQASALASEAEKRLVGRNPEESAFADEEDFYRMQVQALLAMAAANNGDEEAAKRHFDEAVWLAPEYPDTYRQAITAPYSVLLKEDIRAAENEEDMQAVLAAAREKGVPEQALFEAELVYASLKDDTALAARLAPEALAWLDPAAPDSFVQQLMPFFGYKTKPVKEWTANLSGLDSHGQFKSFLHHVLSLAALESGDDEAAKRHLGEAIRNQPDYAEDFCSALIARREREKRDNFRVDLDRDLQTSDGGKTTLRSLLGTNKALLIDFWASWCGPCIASMPSLKTKAETLGPQGFVVVAMNTENDAAKAQAMRQQQGMEAVPWLLDPESNSYSEKLEVESIPRMVVVDPEGKVHFNGHPTDPALFTALQGIDPKVQLPEHHED